MKFIPFDQVWGDGEHTPFDNLSTNTTEPAPPAQLRADGPRTPLENLPAEIKLMVLCQLCNEETLNNLIKACPVYGHVMAANHEEVLTAVMISQLTERSFDPLGHYDVVEVCLNRDMELDQDVRHAVDVFYQACKDHQETKSSRPPKIPLTLCQDMLQIVYAFGWAVVEDMDRCLFSFFRYTKLDKEEDDLGRPRSHNVVGYLCGYPEHPYGSMRYGPIFLGKGACFPLEMKAAIKYTIMNMIFPLLPGVHSMEQIW